MVSICIDKFIKKTLKNNKEIDRSKLKNNLKNAVESKKSGAKCMVCGQPIWAVGSAMCEWDGCFTCITGEVDDSGDYEIDKVNF
jgi:hypothetical protein